LLIFKFGIKQCIFIIYSSWININGFKNKIVYYLYTKMLNLAKPVSQGLHE